MLTNYFKESSLGTLQTTKTIEESRNAHVIKFGQDQANKEEDIKKRKAALVTILIYKIILYSYLEY